MTLKKDLLSKSLNTSHMHRNNFEGQIKNRKELNIQCKWMKRKATKGNNE